MLHYKKYDTYEAYKENQVEKPRLREASIRQRSAGKYENFLRHFDKLKPFFREGDKILCLGARFGEEVTAFQAYGYETIGLDLFGENEYVVKGDWNDMPFDDDSYNIIYTNSIDHSFNLDKEIDEVMRVLKGKGFVVVDLNIGHCGSATDEQIEKKFANDDRYEAILWNEDNDVIDPFIDKGFGPRMVWLDPVWHTYLLERNNGKDI